MLKTLRNTARLSVYLLVAFLFIAGCNKSNPCANGNCQNDGVCVDGHCNCVNGYTGAHCEIPPPPEYIKCRVTKIVVNKFDLWANTSADLYVTMNLGSQPLFNGITQKKYNVLPSQCPFTFNVSPEVEIIKTNWDKTYTFKIMDYDGDNPFQGDDDLLNSYYFVVSPAAQNNFPSKISSSDNAVDIYVEWE